MQKNCHVHMNLLSNHHGTPQSVCSPSTQYWLLLALARCDRLHLTTAETTVAPTQYHTPLPGRMLRAGRQQECLRDFC